ncbi:alpha/beta hydrolase [Allosalinactinospora lopnorensis]|uniref:alpha/beta hydrolase n=1 Tax=Allosalinactinospora lopnorensis TaxID=1352348 RepID=UPI000623C68C|nr:alpha/beta fold hydrolase [Allosalinactinospora lopnorensis]
MPFRLLSGRAVGALAAAGTLLFSAGCGNGETDVQSPGIEGEEREVSFEGGPAPLHGTFTAPEGADGPVPGALIISGSGPTDRDGNSPMRPDAGTNRNFAEVLSEAGVASLRYDKVGSGETVTGQADADGGIGYELFEEGMVAAYAELAAQPEVDPSRLLVLGHSEGALFALRAPVVVEEHPPAALVLAAPPGERYLDTIDRQLTEQARRAESAGRLGEEEVAEVLSDSRYAISRIRAGEPLPGHLAPELDGLFEPYLTPFLRRIDAMDPMELARDLPGGTETLVLWGTADAHIAESDVDRLMTGLDNATRVDIDQADHVFREYDDSPGAAALDADRPFSAEVAPALRKFLDSAV